MADNLPAKTQISSLDQKITNLTETLRPRADGALLRCIEMLLTAGFAFPSAMDPKKGIEIYRFALADLPAVGVQRATKKLIKGEYGRSDHGFLPRPPEFAEMARAEASILSDDLRRAREHRETLAEKIVRRPPVTEEQRARVRAMVASVTQNLTTGGKGGAGDEH